MLLHHLQISFCSLLKQCSTWFINIGSWHIAGFPDHRRENYVSGKGQSCQSAQV